MWDASALLLGIGLGLRHATDADHIAVVSTFIQREPGMLRAARVALLWGLGHTASFLVIGLLIVVAGVRVPEAFERGVAGLVATMLIVLGGLHVVADPRKSSPRAVSPARPVAVGLVHGLAGSAAIALLAATTIGSAWWACLYLLLFGLGTLIGMALLTMALSWPIGWTGRQQTPLARSLLRLPGFLSIALGLMIATEQLLLSRS